MDGIESPYPHKDLQSATWGKDLYVTAHPHSLAGDPNVAGDAGYDLVAIHPSGMLIYKRKTWWRRQLAKGLW